MATTYSLQHGKWFIPTNLLLITSKPDCIAIIYFTLDGHRNSQQIIQVSFLTSLLLVFYNQTFFSSNSLNSKSPHKFNAAIVRANNDNTAQCIAITTHSNEKSHEGTDWSTNMGSTSCSPAYFVSCVYVSISLFQALRCWHMYHFLSVSFCGADWNDAINGCKKRCPTGEDTECP